VTTPESDVLAAIDALERDEIGELVTWQIEQGKAREGGPESPDDTMHITCHGSLEHIEQILAAIDPHWQRPGEECGPSCPAHRPLAPGERVAWQTPEGEMYVDVVREHRPTGGHEWTVTIGDGLVS